MQQLLAFDQSPPLAAPLRFFLSAPLFGVLAGLMLLWAGPDLLASRWTPAALAATHLLTVGFMLHIMLGALLQILPVVAGANMARPLRVASLVHAAISAGTLLLVAAFLSFLPWLFNAAAFLLAVGVALFIAAAARALHGVASTGHTIAGLKLALIGLVVTVGLGVLLSLALGFSLNLNVLQLADLHLAWGFIAWATVLLAAVGYVVVPMFQLTPAYPEWFARAFCIAALMLVSLWSVAELARWDRLATLCSLAAVAHAALFAGLTLAIQRRSKRARFDATQHLWRWAMISGLAASLLWVATRLSVALADWTPWPMLFAVLLIYGGFVSVMVGMLYKIVPFLIWLHLQNRGQGRVLAPNMKKIIDERAMQRQMLAHFAACGLLLLAVCWPEAFVYPAGLAVIASNGWLLYNLLAAVSVYRHHLLLIAGAPGP